MAAIRRQRREAADAEAESRFQQDVVGPLCGLTDLDRHPTSVAVGWKQPGMPFGGVVYCLTCRPSAPTPHHTLAFDTSYVATRTCLDCGRRLDHHI